jgi:hypothetical protein
VTQQPPPGQSGGYYQSQYSQQPSQPQQPAYPQQPQYPQQPSYPQQDSYASQQPPYPQQGGYAQQQTPYPSQYPQDPPPASPYPQGQQPGYDYQAPTGYQQPGYYPSGATPTPPAKSGRGKLFGILGGVGGAVLLGGGVIAANLFLGAAGDDAQVEAETPEVGECITEASLTAPETEVVACDSAEAAWLVLGNAGEFSESEFDATPIEELCGQWETTGYALWIGVIGGDGQVVCLEQVAAE